MEEKQPNTPIKRVQVNYISAIHRTPPKEKIAISSADMEKLDNAIREKIKQNTSQFNMARDSFNDDVVK